MKKKEISCNELTKEISRPQKKHFNQQLHISLYARISNRQVDMEKLTIGRD
jgi:hypothetical protein